MKRRIEVANPADAAAAPFGAMSVRSVLEVAAVAADTGGVGGAGRRADLEAAAKGHVLGRATLVGTYARAAR